MVPDPKFPNEKSTHLKAPVKSSKIITGFSEVAWYIPSVSFVYPKIKVCPAIKLIF